jgi:hypothetical protein
MLDDLNSARKRYTYVKVEEKLVRLKETWAWTARNY